ncbi:hypothetical protein [Phocaeicola barnesiae]|uniref:hypothetical protein n=1 Tax=Phocaeicola barnesiae TaxID=376804 RepID=UPI0003A81897|nr:hypothetical protein [Phocaeicola barnesiae]
MIMKMKYNRWLLMLMCASFAFTGCEKEDLPENGTEQGTGNETEVPEGYFVANLMPTTYDLSRGLVIGESTAVQSLRFLIFKKEKDDDGNEKYMYYNPNNDASFGIVFEATNQSGLVNQTHIWPLDGNDYNGKLTVTLPVGDYRVVFLGNMMTDQFTDQEDNSEIVYIGNGEYDNVRINLPSAGPQAFYPSLTDGSVYQNAFYMGAADFNINNPSPKIVLQRLLSQSCFSRDLIDTKDAVGMLVQSIVDQIKDGQLSTDIVKGVLRTNLTKILEPLLGDILLYPLTTVVDRLVNILLGDLVNALHEAVLEQVTVLVNNELKSGSYNEAALYKILNPWSTVGSIDAKVALAKSIDLNRRVKSYSDPLLIENITVKEDNDKAPNFTITSLNGPFTLIEAKVHDTDANGLNNAIEVLRPAVSEIDDALLAGLLINIETSLAYTQESNQRYTTKYDLLNLKLTDSSPQDKGETINIETALSKVLDAKKLTTAISGDGILSGVLSGLLGGVDGLVNSLLGPLETSLLENLDLRLPNIAIGNISLDGRWDVTRQDDNTIIETEIGGYDN